MVTFATYFNDTKSRVIVFINKRINVQCGNNHLHNIFLQTSKKSVFVDT